MYDYFLGGTDNFAADRIAAEAAIKAFPGRRSQPGRSRAFLRRVVYFLAADAGIRQFLDIGAGLPSGENVHQVAQSVIPDATVVYVDNDPIVLAHADASAGRAAPAGRQLPGRGPARPGAISSARPRAGWTSASRSAILLLGILHNIGDEEDPEGIVADSCRPSRLAATWPSATSPRTSTRS